MKLEIKEYNIRLDKCISNNTEYSRSLIEKMINAGYVHVNGEVKKGSYVVSEKDEIEVKDGFIVETELKKSDIKLDIVYEDNDLIVINKPSGLVVHPGNGNNENTLVNGLLNYTDELSDEGGTNRVGIVHRLDKDTSGLMLVAKNNKTHEILSEGFKNKTIKREYYALVHGVFPSSSAKINAPIGKSGKDFRKQEVHEKGKNAVTNLKVIKRYKKYTLVRLSLETGRTHQIRVHLEYIGYPIVNDPVYGLGVASEYGQFLHSTSIDFNHPITNEEMHFELPISGEFKKFIKDLD